MKIFFISKDASWQKYREEILGLLAQEFGVQVEILTIRAPNWEPRVTAGVRYRTFRSILPTKTKASFFPGALIYLLRNRPNVVMAISNTTQITEYLALIICRLAGIPFVWWTHGYDHMPHRIPLIRKIKASYVEFFFRLSTRVVTFSQEGKAYLTGRGIENSKMFVAPNTLDTDKLIRLRQEVSKEHPVDQLKDELGFRREDFVLLFVGRLYKEKRADEAVGSFEKAYSVDRDLRLVIIGEGEERTSLETLVASRNLQHVVQFKGAIYDDKEISKWFTIASVYLMPGALGLGLIHAFCFGLPVLAESGAGHGPELQYLRTDYNGYLVTRGGTQELADKIVLLHNDTALLAKLSMNCLRTVDTEANSRVMISQLMKALTF